MERTINGKNNKWKATYDKIFVFNKISNMIYMVKNNLVPNIL